MKVTFIDEQYPPLGSGLSYRTPDVPGNVHLTTVVKSLQNFLGRMATGKGFDNRDMVFDIGFLWEHVLEMAYKDRLGVRLGEVSLDGIVGSPDGMGPDPEGLVPAVLEEYKATWKSAKRLPQDDWYWMAQVKSYLKMTGLLVFVMRIFYINGDYKFTGPIYRVLRGEFTQKEVDDNWRMVINHKADVEKVLLNGGGVTYG